MCFSAFDIVIVTPADNVVLLLSHLKNSLLVSVAYSNHALPHQQAGDCFVFLIVDLIAAIRTSVGATSRTFGRHY